jgi:hypothetical protein
MKIVVCTMHSPCYAEVAAVTVPIMEEYSKIHGYLFHEIKIADNAMPYSKIEYMKKLSETDIELVWYLDVDAVVTNLTIPIETFIDDKHDFFITEDFNELNGGSVIIKNNDGGRWMIDFILDHRGAYNNEQNVLNAMRYRDDIKAHMKILKHPSINSYNYNLYPECKEMITREQGNWHEGDFVLHVPAIPISQRAQILNDVKIIE